MGVAWARILCTAGTRLLDQPRSWLHARARPGPGPPPLLRFGGVHTPPPELRVMEQRGAADDEAALRAGARSGSGLFLYDPFQARRDLDSASARETCHHWVVGETGAVEVDVSNPSSVPMRVRIRVFVVLACGQLKYW